MGSHCTQHFFHHIRTVFGCFKVAGISALEDIFYHELDASIITRLHFKILEVPAEKKGHTEQNRKKITGKKRGAGKGEKVGKERSGSADDDPFLMAILYMTKEPQITCSQSITKPHRKNTLVYMALVQRSVQAPHILITASIISFK